MSEPETKTHRQVFAFDRYIDGMLMAEGVKVVNEPTLEAAMRRAAIIANPGINGQAPVLILRPTARPEADSIEQRLQALERFSHEPYDFTHLRARLAAMEKALGLPTKAEDLPPVDGDVEDLGLNDLVQDVHYHGSW